MARPAITLTGDKALDRKLATLSDKGAKRSMKAGINAGLTVMARAMRKAITATNIPGAGAKTLKKVARASIGKKVSVLKSGPFKGENIARVGFKVGKKATRARKGEKTVKQQRQEAGKTGVGVGLANIHWWVVPPPKGQDVRKTKAGKSTGKLTRYFEDVAVRSEATSGEPAAAAAVQKTKQVILREAAKRG